MNAEHYRAILEHAVDGIITIDAEGVIQTVNAAAERIFGYDREEMLGHNVRMIMPEPHASAHDDYMRSYLATGVAKIIGIGREVQGRRKDGRLFPLDLAISELRLEGSVVFAGIVRDISERKAAEAELERLYGELSRQQQALAQHEKMAAIGLMAAGVAHEITNPLASIDSLIQLAQRKPGRLTEETLAQIDRQAKRIGTIVRQLTEFAHPLEQGWTITALDTLVSDALQLLRFDQRLRRVEVRTDLDPGLEARVIPQSIHQIVVNLVSNAVDALESVQEPLLELVLRRDGDQAVLTVADNGPGIAPEHVSRIFEPFFTTKPLGRGTGLGLAISYNIARNHHGRIEVDSRPGQGARFSLLLPLADGGDAER